MIHDYRGVLIWLSPSSDYISLWRGQNQLFSFADIIFPFLKTYRQLKGNLLIRYCHYSLKIYTTCFFVFGVYIQISFHLLFFITIVLVYNWFEQTFKMIDIIKRDKDKKNNIVKYILKNYSINNIIKYLYYYMFCVHVSSARLPTTGTRTCGRVY